MKNADEKQKKKFPNSKNDTMTHFNISLAVKRRRDNIKQKKWTSV